MGSCIGYFASYLEDDKWDKNSVQLTSREKPTEGDPLLKSFSSSHQAAWEEDADVEQCQGCNCEFSILNRRHHCRRCGDVFCNSCSSQRAKLLLYSLTDPARVCDKCFMEAPSENLFVDNHLPRLRTGAKVLRHGPFSLFGGTPGNLVLDHTGESLVFSEGKEGAMQLLRLTDIVSVKNIPGSNNGWHIVLRTFDVKFDSKTEKVRDEWVSAVSEGAKRANKPKLKEAVHAARAKRKTDNAVRIAMQAQFETAEHRRKENSEKRASLASKYGRNARRS